jgi:hypothetical protein
MVSAIVVAAYSGQTAVYLITMAISAALRNVSDAEKENLDILWRVVVIFGIAPALTTHTLILTYKIPESPRWKLQGQQIEGEQCTTTVRRTITSASSSTAVSYATYQVENTVQPPSLKEILPSEPIELDASGNQSGAMPLRRPSSSAAPEFSFSSASSNHNVSPIEPSDTASTLSPTQPVFRSFSPVSSISSGHARHRSKALVQTMFQNLVKHDSGAPIRRTSVFVASRDPEEREPLTGKITHIEPDHAFSITIPPESKLEDQSSEHSLEPGLIQFYRTEGNWRSFCACSANCFTIGFACHGLGDNDLKVLNSIFNVTGDDPLDQPVFDTLIIGSFRLFLANSLPALCTGALWIWLFGKRIKTKRLLFWSLIANGLILMLVGTFSLISSFKPGETSALPYALCQIFLTSSPTYMLILVVSYRHLSHWLSQLIRQTLSKRSLTHLSDHSPPDAHPSPRADNLPYPLRHPPRKYPRPSLLYPSLRIHLPFWKHPSAPFS